MTPPDAAPAAPPRAAAGARPLTRAELDELPPACTYRGCPRPPVKRLEQSIGGRPWYGCAEHYPAMLEALHTGMPGATSGGSFVRVIEIHR